MRPEFAAAIDPIFYEVLSFRELMRSQQYVTADVRASILKSIDTAEIKIKDPKEWKLSQLALCAWIDALLIDADWTGSTWWENNCLEVHYFGARRSYGEFFQWAKEAAILPRKDALEVFYLAVVLGFRGLYADPDTASRSNWISNLQLPDTIEDWCRITARSLQLSQGRPEPREIPLVRSTAKPLHGPAKLAVYSMIGSLLAGLAAGTAILVFKLMDF